MLQALHSDTAAKPLQRARGAGRVIVRGGESRLAGLYQQGCSKIRIPRSAEAPGLEAVLINTAGGLTGGDEVAWRAEAHDGARLTLTSQACERVYRSLGDDASVRVELTAGAGAVLNWLPQETILFDGAALARALDVNLDPQSEFLGVEAVILGRQASGETVRQGRLHDRWRVRRDGRLIFADDLKLQGAVADNAALAPILGGARAFATILYVGEDPERRLEAVRAALGSLGGASAIDGRLLARAAAPDSLTLRRALIPALEILRDGAPLPRAWRS